MYLVLHGNDYEGLNEEGSNQYKADKIYYQILLNNAPPCGPYKIKNADNEVQWGNIDWSSSSRLVWPERNGFDPDQYIFGDFAGLDYMLLFNLYFLNFTKKEYKQVSLSNPFTNETKLIEENQIVASNIITGGNVIYSADNSIKLTPGFKCNSNSGSIFIARIKPNDYIFDYKNNNTYSCAISSLKSDNSVDQTIELDSLLIHPFQKQIIIENNENNYFTSQSTIIFPNPNNGIFTMESGVVAMKRIEISDITGKIVYQLNCDTTNITINLSLKKGIYIVKINYAHGESLQKIVID
jgi:hypothetical protein